MEGFCAERDDVLISIQRVLFAEMQPSLSVEPDAVASAIAAPRLEPPSPKHGPRDEVEWARPAPSAAGSRQAMRRDLMLEQALADLGGRIEKATRDRLAQAV